jgi:two-component system phosphate regulon sensor histidine kinase PhoR
MLAVSVPLSAALALGAEWLLLRGQDAALADRLRADLRGAVLLLFGAGIITFAGFGYMAARRLARPLEQVASLADRDVASPDSVRALPESGADTEEARRLAASIRRMHASLVASLAEATADREQLQSILAGMREGILVLSHERRVLLSNRALVDILLLPLPPEAGQPLELLLREPSLLNAFERCCAHGETVSENVTLGGVAGRSYEVRVEPFRPAGSAGFGAIGVFFDVTRLHALEKVRRDFIVNVSHELRTPLTAIRAFVETLQEGALEDPEHSREFLAIIRRHCDRMQALINDLTDLSMIETGSVALDLQEVDVAAAALETFATLKPRADAAQVRLESSVPRGLAARADPQRLEQILLNLVENAIKFNRPGGAVRLQGARLPRAVRIEVSDTGIGIPSDHLEKVFHRFHRVDTSRSREQGGTGLGLAIVKHLVRLHGGSIRAESDLGRGSRFTLEFPAA